MRRAAPAGAALLLIVTIACRQAEPPPRPSEPSPEQQAKELVARARRDVEREPPALAAESTRVHVPLADQGERLPLLVFLHGLGGSGQELVAGLRLAEMAEAFGFAFIAPEGVVDRSGRRFWNAGRTCCNFDEIEVDHVAALARWIGEATAHRRVDPARVYLVGFSNGGFMAYRAACELGRSLAGIFSIAGAGLSDTSTCRPDKALSVVQIHGDRDAIVKFDGGHLFADTRRPRYPSAEKSLKYWATFDGCTGEPAPLRELDLDPRTPGAETTVSSYAGCSGRRVELWRIAGGDHSSGLSRFSLKAILDFIASDRSTAP
jgi:polyhydroxybutyrate depolymerase